jgi:lambda family phage portal protein
MNFIDKFIEIFDPQSALKRKLAREVLDSKFSFDGGSKRDRFSTWYSPSTSVNGSMSGVIQTLRDRSRDLARNNPYAVKAKQAIGSNVIGKGITAQIKDDKNLLLAQKIQELWWKWADSTDCDSQSKVNLYGIQRQVIKTIFESGEVLIRKRRRRSNVNNSIPLELQVMEPEFLDDSKEYFTNKASENYIYKGIEFNSLGNPVAYWLYPEHPGEDRLRHLNHTSVRVPASEIIHLFRVDRPGQIRGIPWLTPAIVHLKDFNDYEQTQLVRQKIAACFMAFYKDIDPNLTDLPKNESGQFIDKVTPALIEALPHGRDIVFANPPTVENYKEYSTQILRGISVGVGVPYEVLTSDYSQVNFSSARMGWLEFHRSIEEWQNDIFLSNFLPTIWDWFRQYADISGLDTSNAYVVWTPQRRAMIDPSSEIKAIRDEVRAGLNSLSGAIRELGRDPQEVFDQLEQDLKDLETRNLVLDSIPKHMTQAGMNQIEPQTN